MLDSCEQINQTNDKPYIISVSHGIIEFDAMDESGIEGLIKKADSMMYAEKRELKKEIVVIRGDKE